jgi:LPXTG-motif cell wall-anchored protein
MVKRTIAAAALGVALMAAPAGAQQYPPAVNTVTVGCPTPAPGETVALQARTFAAGAAVTFTLASDATVIATASADASGAVSVQATIPAATAEGGHTITAAGQAPDGSTLSTSANITVTAGGCGAATDPATEPSGNLPRTGDDSSISLAKLGLALAALGGIITAIAAKRRKAAAMATG